MFLKPATLNALMKQAYRTGLTVARTEDDWLYIAGRYWEVSVKKEFVPRRTLGDIIALTGELPGPGERFVATKEGNQIELELPLGVNTGPFKGNGILTVTNVLLTGTSGIIQRLLQDEETGNIYVVNNVFVEIVDNRSIDKDNGEIPAGSLLFNPVYGILWRNNVCRFRANFRTDDRNGKILKNLEGADITPEVSE